ncbi:MAG TPA: T9SS type A sorting domain-containing protein, partial [Saprospiraceae bacterium]|nr:T9SS type A sorting domain-containing protein [Saprospiraceae bacterium]
TVSDVVTRSSYFVTVMSTKDLNDFSIIDKSPIDYPHFGLLFYNTIFNENTSTYDLVFTLGFGFENEREAMYVAIDARGEIQQLKVINIDDHLLYDHYYNQTLKRHYISSSSYVYELDEAFNLIKETNIFVTLGETRKFNFDQRILFASDTEIHLVGRWSDRRKPYIYKIQTNLDGTFESILYDEAFFPEVRSYVLTKQYTKDKTIVSYSTDLLDTNENTPNTTFLWELGENISKERQYRIEDGTKKVLIITDIDEEGNMLGYGSEYGTNKSIFFILSEDNSFLVNNIEIDFQTKPTIYPNPSSQIINIEEADKYNKNVVFTSISGHIRPLIIQDGQIDVSTLSTGLYIIALTDATSGKVYRQKIIKID